MHRALAHLGAPPSELSEEDLSVAADSSEPRRDSVGSRPSWMSSTVTTIGPHSATEARSSSS